METMILSLGANIQYPLAVLTKTKKRHDRKHGEAVPNADAIPKLEAHVASASRPDQVDYASVADAQLLRFIAAGKSEALEALYDRYVKACYGLALRVVVDPYIAEEIVQ